MIGANPIIAGTPAAVSSRIAAIRRSGVEALGSIARASLRSSDVTETETAARFCAAIGARMSMSRVTSAFLVVMPTGWR